MDDQPARSRSERAREDFTAVVHAAGALVYRSAVLLSGDTHLAEDLMQATCSRLFASWSRVRKAGDPVEIYSEGDGFLTVVGPVRDGRFLTLAATTLTVDQIDALARSVTRRQQCAARPWSPRADLLGWPRSCSRRDRSRRAAPAGR